MRMAADHLLVHIAAHIGHGELTGIGSDLALQHHLQKHVAQLFAQVGNVALFDGVHGLVGLFDHVAGNGGVRLLAVPRAAVGSAQGGDGIDECREFPLRLRCT